MVESFKMYPKLDTSLYLLGMLFTKYDTLQLRVTVIFIFVRIRLRLQVKLIYK